MFALIYVCSHTDSNGCLCKSTSFTRCLSVMHTFKSLKILLFSGIICITGFFPEAYAAPDIAEPEPADPAVLPTMVPGKMETADSAFAKLDIGKKGYITKEDTDVLDGFEDSFAAADINNDKKLTPDEFIQGWENYSGVPSNPDTFQRKK